MYSLNLLLARVFILAVMAKPFNNYVQVVAQVDRVMFDAKEGELGEPNKQLVVFISKMYSPSKVFK